MVAARSTATRAWRRRSALRRGDSDGRIFSQRGDVVLPQRMDDAGSGLALGQRRDHGVEARDERRGVEVADPRAEVVAGAPDQPRRSGKIDVEAIGRGRRRLEREVAAPGAQLQARPIEVRRREVAGVELLHQQHVDVFLLDAPPRRQRIGAFQRRRHALDGRPRRPAGTAGGAAPIWPGSSARCGTAAAWRRCRGSGRAARSAAAPAAASAGRGRGRARPRARRGRRKRSRG